MTAAEASRGPRSLGFTHIEPSRKVKGMRATDKARAYREMSLSERFASGYAVNDVTGCWDWLRSVDTWGYGRLTVDGRQMQAHRVALLLAGVELVPGLEVDRLCRNRRCVNPEHLEQVSHAENGRRRRGLGDGRRRLVRSSGSAEGRQST